MTATRKPMLPALTRRVETAARVPLADCVVEARELRAAEAVLRAVGAQIQTHHGCRSRGVNDRCNVCRTFARLDAATGRKP